MSARFPWGLTIVCALAFALLCGLGVWQVQRMQWKKGLIARAEAAAALPPAPLAEVLAGDTEFRKATFICPGLAGARFVELQSIWEGRSVVRLISVCRPVGTQEVFLVDRGFVDLEISARPPVTVSDSPVTVVGEFRSFPAPGPLTPESSIAHFYARDNVAMAKALGVDGPVRPEAVYALTSSNPEWPALKPSAPPAAFSNNHLGYALTWFGLALALAGFYVVLLRKTLKQPRSASEATGKETSS